MLINFSISNYGSFKEESFLALNEVAQSMASPKRFSFSGKDSIGHVSHLCGIFGANGSGKTTMLDAMRFASHLVLYSATSYTQDDELYHNPHKFDEDYASAPSEYEFTFKIDESIFRYGFSHTAKKFYDEWLYETPVDKNKRQRTWFTRNLDNDLEKYEWYINDAYITDGNRHMRATRTNALFLSSAVRDNSKELFKVFNWFKTKLHFVMSNERIASDATSKEYSSGENSQKILSLLQGAGIHLSSIKVVEEDFDESTDIPSGIPSELKDIILKGMKGKKTFKTRFLHETRNSGLVSLDLENQSDGTQILYSLAWPLLDVLDNSATLVVDELHNSLHPHLMRYIVKMFNSQNSENGSAQLIFSSHDTNVMGPSIMSDEQVWFTEKNKFGESNSYSLSDVTNKRSKNYSKSYLDGRFGAVPKISETF